MGGTRQLILCGVRHHGSASKPSRFLLSSVSRSCLLVQTHPGRSSSRRFSIKNVLIPCMWFLLASPTSYFRFYFHGLSQVPCSWSLGFDGSLRRTSPHVPSSWSSGFTVGHFTEFRFLVLRVSPKISPQVSFTGPQTGLNIPLMSFPQILIPGPQVLLPSQVVCCKYYRRSPPHSTSSPLPTSPTRLKEVSGSSCVLFTGWSTIAAGASAPHNCTR